MRSVSGRCQLLNSIRTVCEIIQPSFTLRVGTNRPSLCIAGFAIVKTGCTGHRELDTRDGFLCYLIDLLDMQVELDGLVCGNKVYFRTFYFICNLYILICS